MPFGGQAGLRFVKRATAGGVVACALSGLLMATSSGGSLGAAPVKEAIGGVAAAVRRMAATPVATRAADPTRPSAAAGAAPAPASVGSPLPGVDAYVASQMSLGQIPGLAVAVVDGTRTVEARGFGASGPSGAPVTAETPFQIASLSKSLTAFAVMQLVSQGRVDLNAPVVQYLPSFQVGSGATSSAITVADLLHQDSGISGATGDAVCTSATLAQAVASLAATQPFAAPGTTWQYADSNFDTLGLLIEAVSGQSYPAYMSRNVFGPLGMTHTYVADQPGAPVLTTTGHTLENGVQVAAQTEPLSGCPASAAIVSTAGDMARYMTALLNDGTIDGTSVLPAAAVAQLFNGTVPTDTPGASYGMGWFVGQQFGNPAVWHMGDLNDFHADIVLVPGAQVGVVVLMNANSFAPQRDPYSGTVFGVLQRVLGSGPGGGATATAT